MYSIPSQALGQGLGHVSPAQPVHYTSTSTRLPLNGYQDISRNETSAVFHNQFHQIRVPEFHQLLTNHAECVSNTPTTHHDYGGYHDPSAFVSGHVIPAQPSMMSSQLGGHAFRSPNTVVNQQPYQQEQYQWFQHNSGPATYEGFQNDPIELAPGVFSQQSSVTGPRHSIQASDDLPSSSEWDPELDKQISYDLGLLNDVEFLNTSQLEQQFQKACFASGNGHPSIPSNDPRENQSATFGDDTETLMELGEDETKQLEVQLCSRCKAKAVPVQSKKNRTAMNNSSACLRKPATKKQRSSSASTTASSCHGDFDPDPPPDCCYYRRLFENPNSPEAVSVLMEISKSSKSRRNFAAKLNKKLFSNYVRRNSNVAGWKKNKLDKKWISKIKDIVFDYRPLTPDEKCDKEKAWRKCEIAIDTANRQ